MSQAAEVPPNNEMTTNSDGTPEDDLPEGVKLEDWHAKKYPMRFTTISLPIFGSAGGSAEAYLNSVTSIFGFAFLWGLAIWCMADPDGSNTKLSEWKAEGTCDISLCYIEFDVFLYAFNTNAILTITFTFLSFIKFQIVVTSMFTWYVRTVSSKDQEGIILDDPISAHCKNLLSSFHLLR